MAKRKLIPAKKSLGFTLVEVLISMVVFSLLMILVSNAMSFATRYWTQEHGNLKQKVSEFIITEKLYRSIAAMQPYAIKYPQKNEVGIFFHGTDRQVTFVSDIGIYQKGPVIISLQIVADQELGTQVQLAEQPLAETMLITPADLDKIEWNWHNVKTNLVSAKFTFYGYDHLNKLMLDRSKRNQAKVKMSWFSNYNGEQTQILPKHVKLEWQQVEGAQTLNFNIDFTVMINSRDRYNFIEKTLYVE